jgi:hypothetical protein
MPPLPNIPNMMKVEIMGDYTSGYKWANVLHFIYSGPPPTSAQALAFASDIYTFWAAAMLGDVAPSSSLESVQVTDLSSDMGGKGQHLASSPGTSSADKLPGNVCTLVSYDSPLLYRGGHPRTYLPCGQDENLLDQGHWGSAYIGHIATQWGNFMANVIGDTQGPTAITELAVPAYKGHGGPYIPGTNIRITPIVISLAGTIFRVAAEIASQRRRIGRK